MQKEFLMNARSALRGYSERETKKCAHTIGALVKLEAELLVLLGALLQERVQLLAALLEAALLLLYLRVRITRGCCALVSIVSW